MHIFVERSKIVWSYRLDNVLGKYLFCDGLMDEVPIQPVVIIIIEEDNVGPKTDVKVRGRGVFDYFVGLVGETSAWRGSVGGGRSPSPTSIRSAT
jgi:hypothetical protein